MSNERSLPHASFAAGFVGNQRRFVAIVAVGRARIALGGVLRIVPAHHFGASTSPLVARHERCNATGLMDSRKPRVLLVDDSKGTLHGGLRHALARCEVEIATDTASAADVIYRIDCTPGFDLIFCDLARGDFPGPELWAYLSLTRKEAASRVVFVASGPLRPETQAFLRSIPNPCIDLRVDTEGLDVLAIRDARASLQHLTSTLSA